MIRTSKSPPTPTPQYLNFHIITWSPKPTNTPNYPTLFHRKSSLKRAIKYSNRILMYHNNNPNPRPFCYRSLLPTICCVLESHIDLYIRSSKLSPKSRFMLVSQIYLYRVNATV
ncbi:hypothetical protein NPIL_625801 [Nephila pilipes]|uniref:Uncharacterized protein n=1 Tax=Nephila pilipes TaxID=299642 RepID=A0A8X6Q5A2_NEPPI|nr:hypothetical protein NPIL_625801 [Nephila pilipes]